MGDVQVPQGQPMLRRLVAAAIVLGSVALPVACTPLDGRSATVELPSAPRHQQLGDGSVAFAAPATAAPSPELAPSTTAPVTTVPPPSTDTTVPPTTVPPEPPAPPTTVAPPTTEAPAAVAMPSAAALSPLAARAVEGLSNEASRQVASDALGLIAYDWQGSLPGWELRFLDPRPGYRGLTYPDERVVEVYVRQGDTPYVLAHVIAHELGHAVDVTWFDGADRARWTAARQLGAGTTWFVDSGGADFASGAGDFAESFAYWQVGPPAWFGELAPPPTVEQLQVLISLVLAP
jgi:hypothetical protein